ncbi:MAG: hypothetical protein LBL66_01230, partial [Clostridiales bacterium]|nr:hypothetical protein [Clostridiales bacterium]
MNKKKLLIFTAAFLLSALAGITVASAFWLNRESENLTVTVGVFVTVTADAPLEFAPAGESGQIQILAAAFTAGVSDKDESAYDLYLSGIVFSDASDQSD